MSSNASYVMCQDRIKKIQRMKDAKAARLKAFEPPPPPAKTESKDKPADSGKTPVGAPPAGAGLNAGTPATPPPEGTKVEATTSEKK